MNDLCSEGQLKWLLIANSLRGSLTSIIITLQMNVPFCLASNVISPIEINYSIFLVGFWKL
jgi:hypothetical protein